MPSVADRLQQAFRRSIAAYGMIVRASLDSNEATDPSITAGSGAPSADEPDGSVYLRTDGGADTTFYVRVSDAWVAIEGAGGGMDLNGGELILDADADTSITADTDDEIDIRVNGADDFKILANVFRALSGSSIEANTINETTAGSGVTVDSTLIKDGGLRVADSGVLAFGADSDVLATHDGTASVRVTNAAAGTMGFDDDVLNVCDPADPTKRVRIDAGTVGAGQTRVLTMPNADVTMGAYAPTLLNVADEAAFKAAINAEAGVDFQAYDAELAAIAGLTSAANKGIRFTGSGAAELVDDVDAASSVGASTAAAGDGTFANAAELPAGTARTYPVTASDGTKAVKVHANDKVTGRTVRIGNKVSNQSLKVFGPSGANINGLGPDTVFTGTSGHGVTLICEDSVGNTWLGF